MISVTHLTKRYGNFTAVQDLSFEIEKGHVYGFLGPNGAGKSTTMNIMTGCLSATDGQVTIGGHDIFEEPEEAKKLIGYLPEQPPLYMHETPLEYLCFVGEAKGLRGGGLRVEIDKVLRTTGIEDVQDKLIGTLSKGYRQRVGIAQALLGDPEVIILDEPTVGLDPSQIIEIRELIRSLGEKHTVILSSHILSEVQAICEKVLIISEGKLVAFDTPENLEQQMTSKGNLYLKTEAGPDKTETILRGIPLVDHFTFLEEEDDLTSVSIDGKTENIRELERTLFFSFARQNLAILEMRTGKASLEEVFLQLTEGSSDDTAAGTTGSSAKNSGAR